MSHVQSTNSYEVHPGGRIKKYIAASDCYKNDDYLTGNMNQSIPSVGQVNASPVRGKRHMTVINPHSERESQELARDAQKIDHNRARGERLQQLEHRNEYANGFGDNGYVTSRKPVDVADNSKESHSRNLRETRYYTEQGNNSNRVTARAYGSNIGYVQFDYSSKGNPISYAKDVVPSTKPVRVNEGLSTSREFLAIDPENAPRNVSPQRKLVKNYEAKHHHGMNIISNHPTDSRTEQDLSPRRKTTQYEQRYQRDVSIISNQAPDGSNGNTAPPLMNSRRYAARDAFASKNSSSNPLSHVLDNIPTASATQRK